MPSIPSYTLILSIIIALSTHKLNGIPSLQNYPNR